MTTEDDFQGALDANPADFHTRLVFADWLQERGDPRAEGYRALGRLHKYPDRNGLGWFFWRDSQARIELQRHCQHAGLADDWYELLPEGARWPITPGLPIPQSLREAEDMAALAFAKLSDERRAGLLNSEPAAKAPRRRRKK